MKIWHFVPSITDIGYTTTPQSTGFLSFTTVVAMMNALIYLICMCLVHLNVTHAIKIHAGSLNVHVSPMLTKKLSHVVGILLTPLILINSNAYASTQEYNVYENSRYHAKISYPKEYVLNTGVLSSDRKVDAFVDPADEKTSISIVTTAVPGDFNKLGSFGQGKETIRDYMLPVIDGVSYQVLNEKVKGETYYIEYTSASDQINRHIWSIFALKPAEAVIGVTIQTTNYDDNKDKLDTAFNSFVME